MCALYPSLKDSYWLSVNYGMQKAAKLYGVDLTGWNKDGKGPSICDVLTGGAHGVPREITQNVVAGKYYPNHEAV
ncbi:hypothetical protein MJN54_31125, partial [Salmonella enterica subsp. enterica serovar Kentucky]|nr:hypothetical protein [Salmonella enterica subsp. enterica serovar Kentucky]